MNIKKWIYVKGGNEGEKDKKTYIKENWQHMAVCYSGADTNDRVLDISDFKVRIYQLYRLGFHDTYI